MKKFLSIIACALTLFVGSASANEGAYVGAFGGANWSTLKGAKTGFNGGLSVGYKFQQGIRAEAEFAYRQNHNDQKFDFRGISDSFEDSESSDSFSSSLTKIKIKRHVYSFMGNVLYDFDLCCLNFTPFIGVGAGYAAQSVSVHAHDSSFHFHPKKNGSFAAQGIAGISYALCDKTDLSLEYRCLWIEKNRSHPDHSVGLAVKRYF